MSFDTGGLFQEWFNSISNELNQTGHLKDLSSLFGRLGTDEERVSFVLNLDCIHDVMAVKPCFRPKSASESNRLRNEGNRFYQKKRYQEALKAYSRSIVNAPLKSEGKELSLAFANISAVLFHLKEYTPCLQCVQQALSHDYPKELRYKLFDRQGKCYLELGQNCKALECLEKAKQALQESKLDQKKKETCAKDIEVGISKSQGTVTKRETTGGESSNNGHFLKSEIGLPKLTRGPNSKFVSASCIVDIAMSDDSGRYTVATQDINVGDILVIEKPFASVLLPKHLETHCYHCLRRVTIPFPCRQCSSVRYCSEACADLSWDLCHSVECQYLDLIHRAGIGGNGHLALRIVAKAGYKFLKKFRREIQQGFCNSAGKEAGCRQDGTYNSSDYLPIYCLVTHSKDRSLSDLFRRSLVAVFLLKTLQEGSFFGQEPYTDKDLAFIGGLILRHLQSNPCNAHEVSELQLKLNSVATSETEEIASGIYATMSLFNHSCDPSVTRNFYGDICVVRAIKNVTKGEAISDNYGTLCALSLKPERHEKLRNQYYFTCLCNACEVEFPLYSEIPSDAFPVFKCKDCRTPLHHVTGHVSDHVPENLMGQMTNHIGDRPAELAICAKCQHTYSLPEMKAELKASEELYEQAMDTLLYDADVKGSLTLLESHLRLLERLVCRPWKEFNNCQEAIKQCYSIMGNCHVTS